MDIHKLYIRSTDPDYEELNPPAPMAVESF